MEKKEAAICFGMERMGCPCTEKVKCHKHGRPRPVADDEDPIEKLDLDPSYYEKYDCTVQLKRDFTLQPKTMGGEANLEEPHAVSAKLPSKTSSAEERREMMRELLTELATSGLRLHDRSPNFKDSEAALAALRPEIDESLEDVLEMVAFIDAHPPSLEARAAPQPRQIGELKVVSWDIGMFSYQYIGTRVKAVADFILESEFDIVCLHEVMEMAWDYLCCRLQDKYDFYRGTKPMPSGQLQDFNATLIRIDTVTVTSSKIVYYRNTGEHRTLLKTEVMIGSSKLCILNTHLESMLGNSKFRVLQIQKCFDICAALPADFSVIFCGSLNIRDWEISKLVNVPKNVVDLWEKFGDHANEFTWDLTVNKLIQIPFFADKHGKVPRQPKKRFDRMYFRKAQLDLIQPMSFDLTGKELVVQNKYYASDHWALVSHFKISEACYVPAPVEKKADSSEEKHHMDLDEDQRVKPQIAQEHVKNNWDDSDSD